LGKSILLLGVLISICDMAVRFSYADRKLNYAKKTRLKAFVASLFEREGRQLDELTYVFCSDDYLLDINRRFLDHDFFTDIITFDLSPVPGSAISGEVYISVDRVKDNARTLQLSFEEELVRVVCHGALHLCGYADKTKREIREMRDKEESYLRLYR
jgi:rRNA maturation RNase YbeY